MRVRQLVSLAYAVILISIIGCGQSLAVDTVLRAMEKEFITIVDRVSPAIVEITATKLVPSEDPALKRGSFGQVLEARENVGTGIIFDRRGYIVTTESVIGKSDKVTVTLADGRVFKAEIVGMDPETDVAVVKIDAKDLPTASLGGSDGVRAGSWMITMGRSYGSSPTLSFGIVSGMEPLPGGQSYYDAIRINTAASPGNSGGGVIDMDGKIVGIITAALAAPETTGTIGYFQYPSSDFKSELERAKSLDGEGRLTVQRSRARFLDQQGEIFAIPITFARQIIDDLMEDGEVERGWLGVFIRPVAHLDMKSFGLEAMEGVVVTRVTRDSPAAKAGIQTNDVIIGFDDEKVRTNTDLMRMVASTRPQTAAKLTIIRDEQRQTLDVVIGKMPKR